MAGWTTLRVAHAPPHRPSAAHKLHRAPSPQPRSACKTKPDAALWHGVELNPSAEAQTTLDRLEKYNPGAQHRRRPVIGHDGRNGRSRSPKCATGTARSPHRSRISWFCRVNSSLSSLPTTAYRVPCGGGKFAGLTRRADALVSRRSDARNGARRRSSRSNKPEIARARCTIPSGT